MSRLSFIRKEVSQEPKKCVKCIIRLLMSGRPHSASSLLKKSLHEYSDINRTLFIQVASKELGHNVYTSLMKI
ncbi:hypothetical protein ACFL1M_03520 [Patescibacteria group bacterium]